MLEVTTSIFLQTQQIPCLMARQKQYRSQSPASFASIPPPKQLHCRDRHPHLGSGFKSEPVPHALALIGKVRLFI